MSERSWASRNPVKVGAIIVVLVLCALFGLIHLIAAPAHYDKYEDLGPNEVAFVVAVEGGGAAGSYNLEDAVMVNAKRIPIPLVKKDSGKMPWSFKWADAIAVFRVDLTPVNQNWTADADRNSPEDERIAVESLDSVGFSVGGTIQARVLKDEADAFFKKYKGRDLDEIINTNVRGFVAQALSSKFGDLPLDPPDEGTGPCCKNQKSVIAKAVLAEARAQFEPDGITIDYFGLIEGLEFDNEEIQTGITEQIKSSQDLITAQNETAAQSERNTKAKEMADAEAYIAEKKAQGEANAERSRAEGKAAAAGLLLAAKEALLFEVEVYERRARADAMVAAAGNLPRNILPEGSGLLMGLDTKEK